MTGCRVVSIHAGGLTNYIINLIIMPFQLHFYNEKTYCFGVTIAITTMRIFEPSHDKTNIMTVRPAKTHISLGARPV